MPVPPSRGPRGRRAPVRRPRRPADVLGPSLRPPRAVVRSAGNWTLQSVLQRHGLGPVAGVDEAGRGASAGPLVVASCVLRPADTKALDGLTDSKLLSPASREEYFAKIRRRALDFCVVVIPPGEVDRRGVHIANIEGMRRAVAGLADPPGYVLTDGFPVRGFGLPSLAVPKGDRVAACVAAASVLAKVTRDRLMAELDEVRPGYGFAVHKGYCTPEHDAALTALGPCPEHRYSFANVAAVAGRGPLHGLVHNGTSPDDGSGAGAAESGDADDELWAEPDRFGWEPGLPEPMDVVMGGPAS